MHAHIFEGTVRAGVREHADFKFARSGYFSKSIKLQYHDSDPREGNLCFSQTLRGSNVIPSEDVHKILDKLFAAMEESPHHRGTIKFPDVHAMPARSAWVTSLGILSCVFHIPCGLAAMLAGWAIDKTETSST
jgi:hypothetical protein